MKTEEQEIREKTGQKWKTQSSTASIKRYERGSEQQLCVLENFNKEEDKSEKVSQYRRRGKMRNTEDTALSSNINTVEVPELTASFLF